MKNIFFAGDESRSTRRSTDAKRRNMVSLFKNTTIIPFKWLSKYRCFYCGINVDEYDKFLLHMKSHDPCDLKHPAFKRRNRIVKIDVSDITCRLCNESFSNIDSIVFHLIWKHEVDYNKEIGMPLVPYRLVDLKCLFCEETFNFFQQLVVHVNTKHEGKRSLHVKDMATIKKDKSDTLFKCLDCEEGFENLALLRRHGFEVHRTDILNPIKKRKPVNCAICRQQFDGLHKLVEHKISNHDKKYCCKQCNKPFTNYITMLRHMLDAHQIGHSCPKCDSMFTRKSAMLVHFRRSHLKERNAPCTVCQKKFFTATQVRAHMLTHTRERKYICHDCGKSYIRKRNLILHISVDHTFKH